MWKDSDIVVSRKDYRMEYQIEFDREKMALNGFNMSTVTLLFVTV